MKILLVTPAPSGSLKGNRVTALRWARLLRELGHRAIVQTDYRDEGCDLLIALHARRSFPAVENFRGKYPDGALVVALTGTDLYQDLPESREAQRSLEEATRLVVLQPLAVRSLPPPVRGRARVIYQSVRVPESARKETPRPDRFEVCVLGHLRPVKDPFRAALAARKLPHDSRVRVLHVGSALSEEMAAQASAEMAVNPRYRWLGERPRWDALRILARSRALVLTSRLEGGANAISEAVVLGVPVLASRIDGSVGLLGEQYPGYFECEDTDALASLLTRVETDPVYTNRLSEWVRDLAPRFRPECERAAWKELLEELC